MFLHHVEELGVRIIFDIELTTPDQLVIVHDELEVDLKLDVIIRIGHHENEQRFLE